MKKEIPVRNQSPFGWWITSILIRFKEMGEDRRNENRRCLIWENTFILKAKDREEAYKKAMELGRLEGGPDECVITDPRTRQNGRWVFEGLTCLLPIYEKLVDGAEIKWHECRASARTIKQWVRKKQELEAFED